MMNRDSEEIQRRILMLLQDCPAPASLPDVEVARRSQGCNAIDASTQNLSDLFLPRPMNSSTSDFSESNHSFSKEPSFELGDVPVVQERFQALLKHRLQSEIQKNPPLFPWESEIQDYDNELAGVVEPGLVSDLPVAVTPGWGWLRQVKNLKLPVPAQIPEPVLATLLQRCQEMVQSSLQEGAKLVQAVEELFPGQQDALNYQANNVMMLATRSPQAPVVDAPIQYESVPPAQQMVLSLLAARELINTLTLTLSAVEPVCDRQWETDAGVVSLHLEYVSGTDSKVRLQAALPAGGGVTVRNGDLRSASERSTAGTVSVELFDPQVDHAYTVELRLALIEQPLVFTLRLS
jgi:hypothetical protein